MTKKIFFYRENGLLKNIDIDKIVALETSGNYVRVIMPNSFKLVRSPLATTIKLLPADKFVRINRCQVVAIQYIDTIGKGAITLKDAPELILPLGKQYYAGLLKHLTILETGSGDEDELTGKA